MQRYMTKNFQMTLKEFEEQKCLLSAHLRKLFKIHQVNIVDFIVWHIYYAENWIFQSVHLHHFLMIMNCL